MKTLIPALAALVFSATGALADCQTFVAPDGSRLTFSRDIQAAQFEHSGKIELCGATFGGLGEDVDAYGLRCGPDLKAYIQSEDAVFHDHEYDDTLTFRGQLFTRNCAKSY